MKTILITGGIGSGKSEVAKYLALMGYPVYDCDSRAKLLYDEVPGLWQYVSLKFEVSDKKELAAKLFSDSDVRESLENVLYPVLKDDILDWKESLNSPLAFVESAVAAGKPLFNDVYDCILFVDAPEDIRLERACRRDKADESMIRSRMAAQSFDFDNIDYIIMNDSDLASLRRQIHELLAKFARL